MARGPGNKARRDRIVIQAHTWSVDVCGGGTGVCRQHVCLVLGNGRRPM